MTIRGALSTRQCDTVADNLLHFGSWRMVDVSSQWRLSMRGWFELLCTIRQHLWTILPYHCRKSSRWCFVQRVVLGFCQPLCTEPTPVPTWQRTHNTSHTIPGNENNKTLKTKLCYHSSFIQRLHLQSLPHARDTITRTINKFMRIMHSVTMFNNAIPWSPWYNTLMPLYNTLTTLMQDNNRFDWIQ